MISTPTTNFGRFHKLAVLKITAIIFWTPVRMIQIKPSCDRSPEIELWKQANTCVAKPCEIDFHLNPSQHWRLPWIRSHLTNIPCQLNRRWQARAWSSGFSPSALTDSSTSCLRICVLTTPGCRLTDMRPLVPSFCASDTENSMFAVFDWP